MKSMRMVAAVMITAAFAAAAFGRTASDNGPQRLIVLLQPGTAPLPDIAALGGSVEFQLADRMIVTVPAAAVAAISSNPRVKFVQRSGAAPAAVHAESLAGVAPTGSGQWSTGAYVYDGAGNISAIGTGSEPNSDSQTNVYAYDNVGRLIQGSANYAAGNRSETYTYDPFGNMTTRTPAGQLPIVMQVNSATNRRSLATYDAAGNEIIDPTISATRRFDAVNMMTYKHAGTVAEYYVYTPDEQRIGVLDTAANSWTWSLRDEGGALLRQYASSETSRNADWTWVEDYVYADGRLLGAERMASQGGRRHFHLDHLGTPRLITGPTGTLIARHDYLPFGEEVTLPDGERRQFTGHERDSGGDPVAMLDYMHARYYRPFTGRFLSVDPELDVNTAVSNPQSWNRYSYVKNNPIVLIDRDGRDAEIAASSNVRAVKAYIAELMRRPSGRAQIMAIVSDPSFKLRIETAALTSPAEIQMSRQLRRPITATFGQTVPNGVVQQSAPGAPGQYVITGGTMTFDPNAIANLHPDPSGTTTAGHEFDHANALQTCGVPGLKEGDIPTSATGTSEQRGKAVAAEPPDITGEQARKILEELIPVKP
jgi:RHS repeat-associated protein